MKVSPATSLPSLPAGFEAARRLDRGPGRSVWRIRDARTGRTEVWKLIEPEADTAAKRAIGEEYLLLERIRHPHWVRPFGFVHLENGALGYRMEDLPGSPPAGPQSEGWAPRDLDALRAVLGALGNLHAIGFAHLDLKPAQILSGRSGTCLVDPGLAAPCGVDLAARGTWGFIAPELLAGGGGWDHRADLYSLGCVLVQVWTGETPLGEGEIAEQIRRQGRRPDLRLRERLIDLPEGLDRVVESLLDPDPQRRPSSAAAAWRSLHTMAGYRDRYLERQHLPVPLDLPFLAPDGVEEAWEGSLAGQGPTRWTITGPIGSGRRRLLERLRARAEVAGGGVEAEGGSLRVKMPPRDGAAAFEITCTLGRPEKGSRCVELGGVGEAAARAALAAYDLTPEGGEAEWTHLLLRLRLEERLGGEDAKRAGARQRRSVAAAMGSELDAADRARLAEALVAMTDEERPEATGADRLVRGGWLRRGESDRLLPAVPPWDLASLWPLCGEVELAAAHGRLLARSTADPAVAAGHAVRAGDRAATLRFLMPGIDALRAKGELRTALDLLSLARDLLGESLPAAWVDLHARLALLDGEPGRSLALLAPSRSPLHPAWRALLEAHLDVRSDRKHQALEKVRALRQSPGDPAVRQIAGVIVTKVLAALGQHDEAIAEGLPLLEEMGPEASSAERFEVAKILLDALSERGRSGEELERVRRVCEASLHGSGARQHCLAASSLGGDAFRRGEFSRAKKYFEESVAAARDWGEIAQTAIAETNLAGIYFEEGRLAACEAMNRQAIALFEQIGDRSLSAGTRLNVVSVLCAAGRWGEAVRLARQVRAELEALDAMDDADAAILLEETTLIETGLLEAAGTVGAGLSQRLEERPQPILSCILWRDRARAARWSGRLTDAETAWERSLAVAAEAGAADEQARTLLDRACAEAAAGRRERAAELVARGEHAIGRLESAELLVRRDFAQAMVLRLGARSGDLEAARETLRQAAESAAASELRGWTWRCHAAGAGLARQLDDETGAIRLIRLAEEGLRELLEAIAVEPLQEAYVALPDGQWFLGWLDQDRTSIDQLPAGSSDLEVFFP